MLKPKLRKKQKRSFRDKQVYLSLVLFFFFEWFFSFFRSHFEMLFWKTNVFARSSFVLFCFSLLKIKWFAKKIIKYFICLTIRRNLLKVCCFFFSGKVWFQKFFSSKANINIKHPYGLHWLIKQRPIQSIWMDKQEKKFFYFGLLISCLVCFYLDNIGFSLLSRENWLIYYLFEDVKMSPTTIISL